ncbi:MAG: endonuclease/exonuclease/phosphatase family protein [Gemmatimonadota bacterium]
MNGRRTWPFVMAGLLMGLGPSDATGQRSGQPVVHFAFDESLTSTGTPLELSAMGTAAFSAGVSGAALRVGSDGGAALVSALPDDLRVGSGSDFSVVFWVRTDVADRERIVVLSQKEFPDNSLASQKNAGWAFYISHGTWAWSLGSGSRRLTYERDNGSRMPISDGQWHQLAMTYDASRSVIRLYYDGTNWVTYHASDSDGFDFTSSSPLRIGWQGNDQARPAPLVPAIEAGADGLQSLVDHFNALVDRPVQPDEFLRLIVDPEALYRDRTGQAPAGGADWERVSSAENALMENPYTIHQALEFMEASRLHRVYTLVDGEVMIRQDVARRYGDSEQITTPDFSIDELMVWRDVLSPGEVAASYADHVEVRPSPMAIEVNALRAAAWNIWHGGKHFTRERHGWDSRDRVAEVLAEEDVDVVMLQETYSSGDYIAAELGYYLATTVDWDYLNQGSNISILSRYPIVDVHVAAETPFNNVGVRVRLSQSQDIHVMSNWYGMNQFDRVFDFHEGRFSGSDSIPVLFGGDFNAVPHTDGGQSPASVRLEAAGFTDAFRSRYPDPVERPGATHLSGRRIDQLFFRGVGLSDTGTRVVSTWSGGFPSDHFMILTSFRLDYATRSRSP